MSCAIPSSAWWSCFELVCHCCHRERNRAWPTPAQSDPRGATWLANWLSGRQAALVYVFAGAMLLVTAGGWIDALTAHEPGRHREAALGRWMKDEFGADRRVAECR